MSPDATGAQSSGATQRFNFFQRMMLRWRELHPYNPVHVLQLPVPLQPERLREVLAAQLEAQGLTGLAVDRRRWRYRYTGGPAQLALRIVDGAGDADATLAQVIEEEFNRPFAPGPQEQPFRFVAIDEHGSFRLALAYDHYVAGGEAIARWLTRLAGALLDEGPAAVPPRLPPDGARYRHALLRHPGWAWRALLGLPRTIGQSRRTCRARFERADDRHNAFRSLRLGVAQTRALRAAASEWGVTLHELLTACLLLSLSPLVPRRGGTARRQELAVASIMNMRRDLAPAAQSGLSPFLAAYRVSHRVPEGIALRQLAGDVHQQSQHIQRRHLYLHSLLGLALSVPLWRLLTPAQRDGFYAKHFPVQAGITSVDLNRLWALDGGAPARRFGYLRAVPTGPLCPLVLAVTQAHDELQLGLAFRTSAFPRETVERLAANLLQHVARSSELSSDPSCEPSAAPPTTVVAS